jgi:hypothetical protein
MATQTALRRSVLRPAQSKVERGRGGQTPPRERRDKRRQVRGRAMADVDLYGFEMDRENLFAEIVKQQQSVGGRDSSVIGVVGFGSLLSEKSALSTFSSVSNFRMGRVKNYRRIFAHAGPYFLEVGIANREKKEMASLSVEPGSEKDSIVVSLFDINVSDIPAFISREEEYRFFAVKPEELSGTKVENPHVICACSTDEEFIKNYGEEKFKQRYLKYGIEKVWDDDLIPCPIYLRHCVLAAKNLGVEAYDSFLDYTFLADRQTTIRSHLQANPEILTTLPPPHLTERYGG